MKYWFADGKLKFSDSRGDAGGFLVIFDKIANYSVNDSITHDDLFAEIASRNRLDKNTVINEGIRLIFVYSDDGIVVSGSTRLDNDIIAEAPARYAKIIRTVIK